MLIRFNNNIIHTEMKFLTIEENTIIKAIALFKIPSMLSSAKLKKYYLTLNSK